MAIQLLKIHKSGIIQSVPTLEANSLQAAWVKALSIQEVRECWDKVFQKIDSLELQLCSGDMELFVNSRDPKNPVVEISTKEVNGSLLFLITSVFALSVRCRTEENFKELEKDFFNGSMALEAMKFDMFFIMGFQKYFCAEVTQKFGEKFYSTSAIFQELCKLKPYYDLFEAVRIKYNRASISVVDAKDADKSFISFSRVGGAVTSVRIHIPGKAKLTLPDIAHIMIDQLIVLKAMTPESLLTLKESRFRRDKFSPMEENTIQEEKKILLHFLRGLPFTSHFLSLVLDHTG